MELLAIKPIVEILMSNSLTSLETLGDLLKVINDVGEL